MNPLAISEGADLAPAQDRPQNPKHTAAEANQAAQRGTTSDLSTPRTTATVAQDCFPTNRRPLQAKPVHAMEDQAYDNDKPANQHRFQAHPYQSPAIHQSRQQVQDISSDRTDHRQKSGETTTRQTEYQQAPPDAAH
ncbi:MAG: hypothetical protein L6R48_07345 [Planctomycetes bacterium]|nr:hypothetical protein [Planctomycetota bacterium]